MITETIIMLGIAAALLIAVTCVTKITAQGSLSRRAVKNGRDMFTLNGYIFICVFVLLGAMSLRALPPKQVILWAAALSVLTMMFQCAYTEAFRCGPISITLILVTFNLAFPVLAGVMFLNEKLSAVNSAGFVFMAAAFVLIYGKADSGRVNKRWLIFTLTALVGSGLSNTVIQLFSRCEWSTYNKQMLAVNYLFSAVICFAVSLAMHRRGENNVRLEKKTLLLILTVTLALGANNVLLSEFLKTIPGSLLYPAYNVSVAVLTVAADMLIFKEKISRKQLVGIVSGITAVLLLNL